MKRVAVVGSGIAGLSCAHRLKELALDHGVLLDIRVFESGTRNTATIRTEHRDGFLIEHGPDSFVSENPAALDLCEKLGLRERIIGTRDAHRRVFVVRHGRLIGLPEGFYLIAPADLKALALSPLFSPLGKARMALETVVPRVRHEEDESVASFIRRRFGREAYERVGQPMIAGLCAGDAERLSARALMPHFVRMEKESGSVIRALARRPARVRGPRYNLFLSFDGGMEILPEALRVRLDGALRCGEHVREVLPVPQGWMLTVGSRCELFDAVCVATPSPEAADLFRHTLPALSSKLRRVPHHSAAVVNLAYRREDIAHPLDGFGFVVPAAERRPLLACTFSSQKFAGRAPVDHALVRVVLGGPCGDMFERSDRELASDVHRELVALLGIRQRPLFATVARHQRRMAQYHVGHSELCSEIEGELKAASGLHLTGSGYRGRGIPDVVSDAQAKAEEIFIRLTTKENDHDHPAAGQYRLRAC